MVLLSELFKIGIGPSSSHTMGPMVAAGMFIDALKQQNLLTNVLSVRIDLYGSLAATGKGHATDTAVLLGLMGHTANNIDTRYREEYLQPTFEKQSLALAGEHVITFNYDDDILWHDDVVMPYHPNALTLTADLNNGESQQQTYYSIGGGFVVSASMLESDANNSVGTLDNYKNSLDDVDNNAKNDSGNIEQTDNIDTDDYQSKVYSFASAKELANLCREHQLSICQLVMNNECQYSDQESIFKYIDEVWSVMQECVKQGCTGEGVLPGGLSVKRRAKALYEQLLNESQQSADQSIDYLMAMDWVDLYALAVNEENANGGRVVTAPTNGAAGIIPAVLHYYRDFVPSFSQQGVYDFFLTATAIGSLIKQNASISGAEVGCQGEVGSACAMAAAGLTQVLGGSVAQCINAAEIGIEHNLGLTCDPIDGLVQVPCIERNAMGAIKAINATRLALRGDGQHFVSLDRAIETMKQTGMDMNDKYKETSKGGLAIYAKHHPNQTAHASLSSKIPTVSLGVSVNYSQC